MAKAYTEFEETLKRSDELIVLYRRNPAISEKEDLLRMAIVLAVSAMDSYFTTKFCDKLVPHLKSHGAQKDLVELLSRAGLNAQAALDLILMKRPFRRIRTLVERSFEKYTTQRTNVIDELFLCFGLKELCKNAEKRANRKNLVKRIETFVDRRNAIVHESDLNAKSKTRELDASTVQRQLDDVKLFMQHADWLIENATRTTKRKRRAKSA